MAECSAEPHFHVVLFGFKSTSIEECGFRISDEWPYGGVYVDSYSDRAVNYVTSYILKADDMSVYEDEDIILPYINVSQRPMIGENFISSKTAERCFRTNDYTFLDENDALKTIPRRFANKMDDLIENPFDRMYRRHERAAAFSSKNNSVTHYDEEYNYRRQVDRAASIQQRKRKEYLNNKCK